MIKKQITLLLFITTLLLAPKAVHARNYTYGNDSLGFPSKLFVAGARRPGELKVHFEMNGISGSAQSKDSTTIPDTSLGGYGGELGLSYRISLFSIGAGYSYQSIWQNTKPEEVNNYNIEGSMTGVNISAGLDFVYWGIFYKHHLSSKYEFDNVSSSGQQNYYKKPESSFTLALHYRYTRSIYLILQYMNMNYSEVNVNNTNDQDLNDQAALKFATYSLGLGFSF